MNFSENKRLSYKTFTYKCGVEDIPDKIQIPAHLKKHHPDCLPKFYCVPCEIEYQNICGFAKHMNTKNHLKKIKIYNDRLLIS